MTNKRPIVWPPSSLAGNGPAEYAAALVAWAGDDTDRLYGASRCGNGKTVNAFVRRLSDAQLQTLFVTICEIREAGTPGTLDYMLDTPLFWKLDDLMKKRSLKREGKE